MGPMTESKNLLECAYHWEKNDPDRVYLTQPMGGGDENIKTWTWKETLDEARRMASYLKSLALPEGSRIALCSKNCAYWIIADLAVWMAGHVTVPIFPTLTADIVKHILEHSESKLLFAGKLDPIWDEMKKGVPADVKMVDFPLSPENDYEKWVDIIAKNGPLADPCERSPEDISTIVYTSGSTGKPKGVILGFGAMCQSARGVSIHLKSNIEDRMLSYLPLAHVYERWIVEAHSLYAGFPVFFAETLDTFIQDLQRARPTLFASVPRLWLKFQLGVLNNLPQKNLNVLFKIPVLNGIIKKKILTQLGLDSARFAGSGSAPIPAEVLQWYRDLGLEVLEGYGMTENFAYSHCTNPGEARPGYIGPPYPDAEHRIDDNGEILVKSPGLMTGYYKDPEGTRESFTEDGFLKTGDLGQIDEKGRLMITGRSKEQFKTSKGKYVAPAPIENLIVNHPRVEACCVAGSGFPQAYGLLMLSEEAREALEKGDRELIERELAEHIGAINESLAGYERLAFLAALNDEWTPENGFLTPTLKIKRAKIEDAYGPMIDGWLAENKSIVWQA